ncbi:MAG: glycosyltransferase family 2 protein [Candidatus Doudnabacteria bacterium]|nr:glycosyltransferase family 2 protein [Candidatus Doudnabacteria bacterium]
MHPPKPTLYRILECIPGGLSWATFLAAIILSYFQPVVVAIFIILFDLYWLFKAVNILFHLFYTYRKINLHGRYDWLAKCRALASPPALIAALTARLREPQLSSRERDDLNEELERLTRLPPQSKLDFVKIYHAIILPTVWESHQVLAASIDSYLACNYPKERLILVLACEERAGRHANEIAQYVLDKYQDKFQKVLTSFHPDAIAGEARTKGSNITYAAKQLVQYIDRLAVPYSDVIVSAFDADTIVRPDYFAQLTYTFLTTSRPTRTSYQPVPLYNNNIWDAPAANRLVAINSSFWQMVESSRADRLVTFSSHSMSLQALVEADFWPVDAISEDSQIFWRCLLHYRGDYTVVPLFTTVSLDAVALGSYFKSLAGQYKQNRRWAWGVIDFPYVVYGFLRVTGIPLWKKFVYGYRLLEGHYFWATAAVMIAFLGWLPLALGRARIENQVFAFNLPQVTGTIMTLSTLLLIFFVAIYFNLLPNRPKRYGILRSFAMLIQWILVPLSSIIFGSIPALDAQTRLMLGKYLEFWVTPKVRGLPASTDLGFDRMADRNRTYAFEPSSRQNRGFGRSRSDLRQGRTAGFNEEIGSNPLPSPAPPGKGAGSA